MMGVSKIRETLKDKVSGASDFLSDLKEGGKEKLINSVNGLGEILPVIAKTGYRLKGIDMEMSVPPSVDLHFEKFKNISHEEIDAILEANEGKDLLRTIVRALEAADDFHAKLKLGNLILRDISVGIGIPPKVTIRFLKKEK